MCLLSNWPMPARSGHANQIKTMLLRTGLVGGTTMAVMQITLVKSAYSDPDRLAAAIKEIRRVGMFSELDGTYAARIGLLAGELSEEKVEEVRHLGCVSAVALRECFGKLS